MSTAQLITAVKDAEEILIYTTGTQFHKCIETSVGRRLANLFHDDKVIADLPWDTCEILAGTKPTNRKLRFYGLKQTINLYTDANDSFEFMPFSEITAYLRHGGIKWAYDAILLRSENMNQKRVKDKVDSILDDHMSLGNKIWERSRIGYTLPNQRDLIQAYALLKHRDVSD